MALRALFDKIAPYVEEGGKYQKFYPIYEMIETLVYATNIKTKYAPHARVHMDLKRTMTYVVLATIPCILWALYNTGLQTNQALQVIGLDQLQGWRGDLMSLCAIGHNPHSLIANIFLGLLFFLPIYLTTLIVGGIAEVSFATIRKHDVNEGFLVTSMLYSLILPATTPLWQVALGILFGVVIGKEVFGGTGKNFLNPALTGRAFLYFAYPAQMSGDAVWVGVDGFTGATALGVSALEGYQALAHVGMSWTDAFYGMIPGSMGETSTLACLIGAAFLLITRIANWRLIVGTLAGMVMLAYLFNEIGSETNRMFAMPWYWHLVTGGFAFGLAFMVTEPVSATMTNKGRLIYGFLIGAMCVLIRVVNPAFPEGMMLAVLFGNIFAPLIDFFIIKADIRRRFKRYRAEAGRA